jgi:uncharacterized Fe-S center protein
MEYHRKRFSGGPHRLDGNVYRSCTFQNADLEFWGGAVPTFIDCQIADCNFGFVNEAANTLAFIKMLNAMPGDSSFMDFTFPISFSQK